MKMTDEEFETMLALIRTKFENLNLRTKTNLEYQKNMMLEMELSALEYRIQRIEDKVFGNRIAEDKENYNNN